MDLVSVGCFFRPPVVASGMGIDHFSTSGIIYKLPHRYSIPADHFQILTIAYHISQRKINIKKETAAALSVFSIASFISMSALLLQLHLSRENEPEVPLFTIATRLWEIGSERIAGSRLEL